MELKEAKEIAKYVVPRLLFNLPEKIKLELIKTERNEDALLSRLTEKAASDIRHKATEQENKNRDQYL